MNNLFILTKYFPYQGGEQFLETEIKYWNDTRFDNIIICPTNNKGMLKSIPNTIKVLKIKPDNSNIKHLLRALLEPMFYKEVSYILRNKKLRETPYHLVNALKCMILVIKEYKRLQLALKDYSESTITLYTYWNDVTSYAACKLKQEGVVERVVSRVHGFDLYEERRSYNYMPFKRQFVHDYDYIYLLSESARYYYYQNYNPSFQKLRVARLGVSIPYKPQKKQIKNKNSISILSLSYCVPVKQLHLIMESVRLYASQNPNKIIKWTHIGGGPLLKELKLEANLIVSNQSNVNIRFLGQLDNIEVKKQLEEGSFDLILNASKSEGTPVSLMEAMSYCIPAVAPGIGGIPDLVNNKNGYLMPNNCTSKHIIQGIDYVINNNISLRINAYNCVKKSFNSDINYPNFINEIEKVSNIYESK